MCFMNFAPSGNIDKFLARFYSQLYNGTYLETNKLVHFNCVLKIIELFK